MVKELKVGPNAMLDSTQSAISKPGHAATGDRLLGNGVALLALDGDRLQRDSLSSLVQLCRQITRRMDILMISPPKEPLHTLGKFLQALEGAGIDYRLTSAEGSLEEETLRYVQKRRQISVVLIGSDRERTEKMDETFGRLREMGYPVGVLMA